MIIFGELLHPNSKIHAYEEVCEMGRNHGVDSIGAHLFVIHSALSATCSELGGKASGCLCL
ncbi:Uncharacterised protein [Segatella copri]|nr:Uncharacterised protein [Segatella copri]